MNLIEGNVGKGGVAVGRSDLDIPTLVVVDRDRRVETG